jgi:hypothetical protein
MCTYKGESSTQKRIEEKNELIKDEEDEWYENEVEAIELLYIKTDQSPR